LKKPKSEKWLAAMFARRGRGTNQYTKAIELGSPKPVLTEEQINKRRICSTGKKHTAETKKKLSELRIKYLQENPEMVPYKLNHKSKGPSYPEMYWKEILDYNNIIYSQEYPIGLYQLDFAILEYKIDLEIDGDQHYLDKKIMESDIRRNKYLENLGWTIIRIKWSDYKKILSLSDRQDYVKDIIHKLNGPVVQ